MTPRLDIAITNFRPCVKGGLRAFLSVELRGGFIINDCRLMETAGGRWIAPPSREYKKRDGTIAYADTIEFSSRDAKQVFEAAVLAALDDNKEGS
jgi:DNA-binding cell septation regulator SpoVG